MKAAFKREPHITIFAARTPVVLQTPQHTHTHIHSSGRHRAVTAGAPAGPRRAVQCAPPHGPLAAGHGKPRAHGGGAPCTCDGVAYCTLPERARCSPQLSRGLACFQTWLDATWLQNYCLSSLFSKRLMAAAAAAALTHSMLLQIHVMDPPRSTRQISGRQKADGSCCCRQRPAQHLEPAAAW